MVVYSTPEIASLLLWPGWTLGWDEAAAALGVSLGGFAALLVLLAVVVPRVVARGGRPDRARSIEHAALRGAVYSVLPVFCPALGRLPVVSVAARSVLVVIVPLGVMLGLSWVVEKRWAEGRL